MPGCRLDGSSGSGVVGWDDMVKYLSVVARCQRLGEQSRCAVAPPQPPPPVGCAGSSDRRRRVPARSTCRRAAATRRPARLSRARVVSRRRTTVSGDGDPVPAAGAQQRRRGSGARSRSRAGTPHRRARPAARPARPARCSRCPHPARGDLGVALRPASSSAAARRPAASREQLRCQNSRATSTPRSSSTRAVATASAVPGGVAPEHHPGQPALISSVPARPPPARRPRRSPGTAPAPRPDRGRAARRRTPRSRSRSASASARKFTALPPAYGKQTSVRSWRGHRARGCTRPSRSARPSTSAARSASTGWRVMSLSDTARSSAMASFTADSEVPPRSKKSSRRPIASGGTPSTSPTTAASRCSVGVRGRVPSSPRRVERGGQRGQRLLVDLAVGGQRQGSSRWKPPGPCTRAAPRRAARAAARPSSGRRPV